MTEEEWFACRDVAKLLRRARCQPGGRKIRLFICAWYNRRWNALDERYQRGVDAGERFADGFATAAELDEFRREARGARQMYGVSAAYAKKIQYTEAAIAATHLAYYPYDRHGAEVDRARADEKEAQLCLLRDIFGNPFRPVTLLPAWRTGTAVAIACQMYESRDFSAMPILADALQDAGCASDDILSHCREPGEHVRGCWVVDFVLGLS